MKSDKHRYTHQDCFNIAQSIYGKFMSLDSVVGSESDDTTLRDIITLSTDGVTDNEMGYLKLKLYLLKFVKTKREEQVVELLAKGYSKSEIAKKLRVTRNRITGILRMFTARLKPETRRILLHQDYRRGVI